MKRLHARLRRVRELREKLPTLSQALFAGKAFPYARRRGGFAFVRALITSFFHSAEAAALAIVLDSPYLVAIVTVRLISGMASALIWGATETVRQDVRENLRKRNVDGARARIEEAIARSIWLGALVSGAGVAWVVLNPHLGRGLFSVVDAYALALALRVGISLVSRTYSSGVNAVHRIHRPRWSMMLPDLVDVTGLFLLWRFIGPWSIAFSVLASGILQAAFTYYFSRRAYKATAFGPRRMRIFSGSIPNAALLLRSVRFLLAGLSFELPTWVLLGLWSRLGFLEGGLLLYAARPIASFVLNIPRLYYIDMVAVHSLGQLGAARLERHVRAFTLTALVCLIAASLIALVQSQGAVRTGLVAPFCTFLVAAALFVIELLRSVVAHREGRPALATFGLLVAFASANYFLLAPTYLLIGATLLLALATLFVRAGMRRVDGFVASDREPLPLALWFDYVRRQMAATSILVLKVAPEAPGHTPRHLAIELAQFTDAATTRVGHRYIFVCAKKTSNPLAEWAQRTHGVALVESVESARDGDAALALMNANNRYPSPLRDALGTASETIDSLRAWVTRRHASAVLLDATTGHCESKVGSVGALAAAMRALLGQRPPPASEWGDYDLAMFAPHGIPALLVCMPRTMDLTTRAEIRTRLWRATITASGPS